MSRVTKYGIGMAIGVILVLAVGYGARGHIAVGSELILVPVVAIAVSFFSSRGSDYKQNNKQVDSVSKTSQSTKDDNDDW